MMCKTALAYKSGRAVCNNQIHLVCSTSFLDGSTVFQFDNERQSQIRLKLENTSRCLCQRLHADRYERLSLVPKRKRDNERKMLTQHNPFKDVTRFFPNSVTKVNMYILLALSPPIACY